MAIPSKDPRKMPAGFLCPHNVRCSWIRDEIGRNNKKLRRLKKKASKCSVAAPRIRDLRNIARNLKPMVEKETGMYSIKLVSARVGYGILAALVVAGCAGITANAQTVNGNGTGTNSGYYYSLYSSGGSATMTFPEASKYPGNYAITWSSVNDVVGGKGWQTGSAQTIGYNVGEATGYNNISIYGWTTSPLVEYYICEFGSVANGTNKGSVSSDGHTYTTYEHQQVNQPSIQGTATFEQYLDNWGGASIGSNGTVTTANHFNHWRSLGMNMGAFNYQILGTEAYSGRSGSVNATVW
jgi:endo-1,4-beta-xylanase